jgi:hypothetical protein
VLTYSVSITQTQAKTYCADIFILYYPNSSQKHMVLTYSVSITQTQAKNIWCWHIHSLLPELGLSIDEWHREEVVFGIWSIRWEQDQSIPRLGTKLNASRKLANSFAG